MVGPIDVDQAARQIVAIHDQFPKWSNRRIAEKVGVSHTFVNNLLKEVAMQQNVSTLLDCCVRLASKVKSSNPARAFSDAELAAMDALQEWVDANGS